MRKQQSLYGERKGELQRLAALRDAQRAEEKARRAQQNFGEIRMIAEDILITETIMETHVCQSTLSHA